MKLSPGCKVSAATSETLFNAGCYTPSDSLKHESDRLKSAPAAIVRRVLPKCRNRIRRLFVCFDAPGEEAGVIASDIGESAKRLSFQGLRDLMNEPFGHGASSVAPRSASAFRVSRYAAAQRALQN
jgi:hypothetical protein